MQNLVPMRRSYNGKVLAVNMGDHMMKVHSLQQFGSNNDDGTLL